MAVIDPQATCALCGVPWPHEITNKHTFVYSDPAAKAGEASPLFRAKEILRHFKPIGPMAIEFKWLCDLIEAERKAGMMSSNEKVWNLSRQAADELAKTAKFISESNNLIETPSLKRLREAIAAYEKLRRGE